MIDEQSRLMFERFADRTLPKPEWDHAAHLTVCWVALDVMEPDDAVGFLRDAISSYNDATGVANSATEGYHDTITGYFVGAVASLAADTIDEVISADVCRRDAPLRYWTRQLLFSPAARAGWVDPDRARLPWRTPRSHDPVSVDASTSARRPPA